MRHRNPVLSELPILIYTRAYIGGPRWVLLGVVGRRLFLVAAAVMLAIAAVGFRPRIAGAQQAGLAVGPAIFEAVLEPGRSHVRSIRLANITGFALPIRTQVRALEVMEDVRLADGADTSIFDASQWFSFDETDFILQPGQERQVQVTIAPPPDAEPGGHYATVLFTPLVPEAALKANSAFLASEVGSLAFLTVQGDIRQSARLLPPAATPRLLHFGPIETVYDLQNTGNVHNLPTGGYRIRDFFGNEVAYEVVPPRLVLPGTIQPYKLHWGSAWLLNRYTVTPEFSFGTPEQRLEAPSFTVWVVPWVPLLAGFVLLAAGGWFVVRTRRRWKRAWRALRGQVRPSEKHPSDRPDIPTS